MRVFRSFSTRISLYVILLTALLFLIATLTVFRFSYGLVRKEAVTNAYSQLKALNLEMENVLSPIAAVIDNTVPRAEKMAVQSRDTSDFLRLASDVLRNTPQLTDIIIALEPYYYRNRKQFAAYAIKEGDTINTMMIERSMYEYPYYDWYVIPKCTDSTYWTDPYIDKVWEQLSLCSYTAPLHDSDGKFIGAICASIETGWITSTIDSIRLYENSYNFVLGKAAGYIVHPDKDLIINETIFSEALLTDNPSLAETGKRMIAGETGMSEITIDGQRSIIFFTSVPSNSWSIAAVCPKSDIFAGAYSIACIMLAIALLSLIILAITVSLTVRKATVPLSILAASADKIAKGDFNSPMPDFRGNDEVGRLCRSFSSMQQSLSQYMERLRRTTAVKERIESELNIAREIQMGMVPKTFPPYPERDDIDLYAVLYPAKEIGGDLYDFFIKDDRLFFAIGDVSGKGVPASLLMAVTRSHFRSVASTLKDPAKIIESMNKALAETNETNMFVTIFTGILDLKTGVMSYSNAGHNPPLLLGPSGKVTRMNPDPNLPIGLFDTFEYSKAEITLEPCTTLLLYTDGITEAEDRDKQLYGEQRLIQSLTAQNGESAQDIVLGVYRDVERHVQDAVQSDDLTILAVKYYGNNSPCHPYSHTLRIENKVSEIEKLTRFTDSVCSEAGLDSNTAMSINLALEEAVSNVIFYAFPGGETGNSITVRYNKEGRELHFCISDRGVPFDPTAKAQADITLSAEDRKIGGLGIFLVRQIMDRVEYERKGDENILKLTKII